MSFGAGLGGTRLRFGFRLGTAEGGAHCVSTAPVHGGGGRVFSFASTMVATCSAVMRFRRRVAPQPVMHMIPAQRQPGRDMQGRTWSASGKGGRTEVSRRTSPPVRDVSVPNHTHGSHGCS